MKKTYINPTQKVVNLKIRSAILTASLTIKNADATGEAMGRDYDFEDEEY